MEEEEDDHSPPDVPASRRAEFLAKILIPPPMYPEDTDPLPESILLDPIGYISDRTNDTTAGCLTKGGKSIEVTFWVAHPPRASYFSLRSPSDLGIGDHPAVVTTEKDLALLRVPICSPNSNISSNNSDYFIYEAGTKSKQPKLKLIPMPPSLSIPDSNVALVRFRRRGMFLIAILCWTFTIGKYDLHLYSSQTKSWSKRLMYIDSPKAAINYNYPSKVISIGAQGSMSGLVAWVDLWNGILICDLLQDSDQMLRYIPLPSPRVPALNEGPPLHLRDINVLGGYIIYFEMCIYVGPDQETIGWEGATSRKKVSLSFPETEWEEGCRIKVCNDPTSFRLPPNLRKGSVLTESALKGRHGGFPAISLHDDDVVYIMDKHKFLDNKASVVAVDMKNQTAKGTADFVSGGFLDFTRVYIPSGISRYLALWSSIRSEIGAETSKNGIAKGKQALPEEAG